MGINKFVPGGIKITLECVHDAGDIPQTLVWEMWGVGRGKNVGIYVDDQLIVDQEANRSGNFKKTYILPTKRKASFQNFYKLCVQDVKNESLVKGTVLTFVHVLADGKMISIRRK